MPADILPNLELDHDSNDDPTLRNTDTDEKVTLTTPISLSVALDVAGALSADSADVENSLEAGSATIDGVPYTEKADLTGSDGVLVSEQVPDLAITQTFVVEDETERLELDVEEGDVAIQEDNETTYIFTGGDSSDDDNWSVIQFDVLGAIEDNAITPSTVTADSASIDGVSSPYAEDAHGNEAHDPDMVEDGDYPDLQIDGETVDSTDTINFIPE